ncbi:glycosyltransferase [Paralimibaculum aggregatum]|uniref:Glycosyltransferase n=1 Tax=Paralimibaculum aggregatum TaxID=3036245 RepID=A0ABQ6LJJ2_9RHOB|nr:glycosyltransferase [Limibaculum sp. NKW23]GMG81832.1 glycosyltransferase [Limibaculum sp. NKW23]
MTRVALLVTHLSGSGHLVRMAALGRALAAAGAEVLLLSGGRPLPQLPPEALARDRIGFHQLAPLSVPDFDFSTPRRGDGAPATEADLAARRADLCARLGGFAPDLLVTETFPLGRRRLAAEFAAAIAAARAARPGARVVASLRDVPEPPSRPERLAVAAARLRADYAAVLVHGEAAVLPLAASWPLPANLGVPVLHTGYVGAAEAPAAQRGETVLVAGGGGVLGRRLLALAAVAAAASARPWHLLVGGAAAAAEAAALTARHGHPRLAAEPVRADYPALLAAAACSVSLAGYNTVMDLAACRTPALLVPFAEHGEREQSIRAAALARLDGISVLDLDGLDAPALARAAEAAARAPRRPPWPWPRDGAARAARALLELAR